MALHIVAIAGIVGTALATLGGRLPTVPGVTELSLGQFVETLLLGTQQLEFVLAFIGIGFDSLDGIGGG